MGAGRWSAGSLALQKPAPIALIARAGPGLDAKLSRVAYRNKPSATAFSYTSSDGRLLHAFEPPLSSGGMPDVAAGIPLIQQFSVATDAVEFLSRSLP
jgi:hypothetical protein